ncbi:Proteasome subunit beta type-1-B [Acropora cervicornis]|uniref:Proteasome subunit beta n=1 Tax=Acropora cervicornis TaxID=6130 RepID=A0AAD9VAB7_ACRCE|nr:Proteasome subunit beta type-1-B [Acropora cervicornis]
MQGIDTLSAAGPVQHYFSPYTFNGGTILAIAGEDFSVIATDTRLSQGFSIHTRYSPKSYQLTNSTVLGCAGFHGDCLTLTKVIKARLQMYEHEHGSEMSCPAIAQMLSTELYYRRFFPYYTYNILAGLDSEGKGCVYSFDPVGSYERETYRACGSASSLLQPLLDNQIGFKNQQGVTEVPLRKNKAPFLVEDMFNAAAERDIYTGDKVFFSLITIDGISEQVFPIRKD